MTKENKVTICRIAAAAVLFLLSLAIRQNETAVLFLSVLAYITVGYDVVLQAVKKLLKGHAMDENFLMSIASVGVVLTGEHAENARKVQTDLEMDTLEAGLMPADKVEKIESYLPDGVVAFGRAGMWEAVIADAGVSVIAILNSMRLMLMKENR